MKRFILTGSAILLAIGANVASAQQLPNVGFESWKAASDMGKTYYMSSLGSKEEVRPCTGDVTEPLGWNGSNVNIAMQKAYFIEKETIADGNVAVKLVNKFVGLSDMEAGFNAPGFVTFGTPWICNLLSNGNGGVYGGIDFSFKPDAIKGKFKYAQGDAPEASRVIAYLWNGTFASEISNADGTTKETQNDVDRAVMGRLDAGDVSGDGKLVASCDYEITSTDGDWQDIVIPLTYVEGVGEPTKMNVIISAADYWTRSSIQAGTTLSADDVDFVYYSTLTSLEVGGVAVPDFAADKYVYDMGDAVATLPTEESISAVAKSPHAEVQVTVDEAAWQVRVVVTNQGGMDLDGETSHTYTLQYASSEEYPGYLFANTETNRGWGWNNVNSTVRIVDYKDGTCDFTLLNFSYYEHSCNGMQNFGDIVVKGATVTTDASGVRTIEGVLPEMLLDSGKEVSGKLNGTIDAEGNVNLNLDLNWHNVPDSPYWHEEVLIIEISFSSDLKGEEIDGYLYIVEGEYGFDEDDYKHPIAEKMPVTLLSALVTRTDKPAFPPVYYTLVLKDVTFKNATTDITVPYILKYSDYPQFNYDNGSVAF